MKDTICSLQKQTEKSWEALIIDDNSTDESIKVVEESSRGDQRIKVFQKHISAPKGANASRNLGLRIAKGDFIVFLDSDDILLPECLNNRVRWMISHPDEDFSVFPQTTFEDNLCASGKLINVNTSEEVLDRFLRFGKDIDVPWLNTAPIWKKAFFTRHSLSWSESLPCYQDLVFHITALMHDPRYSIVESKPDCRYRIHSGERIGPSVHDPAVAMELVPHFVQLYKSLNGHGCVNDRRERLFAQSVYFSIIIKLINAECFSDAVWAVERFENAGVFKRRLGTILKQYILARKAVSSSPRLKFYTNRAFRRVTKKSIYFHSPSNYMTQQYECQSEDRSF